MITDVLSSIATVAQKIYTQVALAKANQAQCQVLKARVDIIVKAVKDLDKIQNTDHYRPGLLALESCLKEALKFIAEFSKDQGWFKQALKAGTSEEQFKKITEQLQKTIEQLNLGMIAQQVINHEQDAKAQKADFEFIRHQQDVIAKLNLEANRNMQKLKFQQEQQNDILLKQFASMKAKLNGPTKEKLDIEQHLLVPYHELFFDDGIGKGSFGTVYAGQWCEQAVAIKTVEGSLSKEEHEQFVREVQIMSRLRSPHVVQLYGACLEAERLCLVMEHMEQGSLYTALGNKPLIPEQQHKHALAIAKGLLYLHTKGTVHCDLKSANILINERGDVKLADFGLSKANTQSIKVANDKSQAIEWQAPECLQLHAKFTPESDIFAYGMVLWEMVTAKRPFAKLEVNREKTIIDAVLAGKRETIPKEVPSIYRDIIKACWHKDPHKRPALKSIIAQLETYKPIPLLNKEDHHEKGIKCEMAKEYAEAFVNYEKAAKLGHIKAHTNLGFCYLQGQGVNKDLAKALHYFTKGAEQGHARAMINLGAMYKYGQGVSIDLKLALEWYNRAAALGDEKAKLESTKLMGNLQTTIMAANAAPVGAAVMLPQYQAVQQQQLQQAKPAQPVLNAQQAIQVQQPQLVAYVPQVPSGTAADPTDGSAAAAAAATTVATVVLPKAKMNYS